MFCFSSNQHHAQLLNKRQREEKSKTETTCMRAREAAVKQLNLLQVELSQTEGLLPRLRLCGGYAGILCQELLGTVRVLPYGLILAFKYKCFIGLYTIASE